MERVDALMQRLDAIVEAELPEGGEPLPNLAANALRSAIITARIERAVYLGAVRELEALVDDCVRHFEPDIAQQALPILQLLHDEFVFTHTHLEALERERLHSP